MKELTLLFVLSLFVVSSTFAQPAGSGSSGFGGPALKVTQVNDETAILLGGRIGGILNHVFVVGAGFYRLLDDVKAPRDNTRLDLTLDLDLNLDYVGLDLEYIFMAERPVHFSIQGLFGGGRAQYWEGKDRVVAEEGVWVVEPGANIIFKIAPFFRIELGASYRFVSGVNRLQGLEARDLSGPSAGMVFQFGKFWRQAEE
jgi:hypothetical protein